MRFRRALDREPSSIDSTDRRAVDRADFLAVSTTYSRFAELQITLPSADASQPTVQPNEINVAVTAEAATRSSDSCCFERRARIWPMRCERTNCRRKSRRVCAADHQCDAQAPHQAVIGVMEAARLAASCD